MSITWEDHLAVKHFGIEGQQEIRAMLFIPRRAPSLPLRVQERRNHIKQYVRRVSIINDCHELMPERLNIVKCGIDSEDLPLNVSCETLQQNMNWRLIMMNWVE